MFIVEYLLGVAHVLRASIHWSIDTRRVQVQTFRGFAKPTGLCVANDQLLVSDRGANEEWDPGAGGREKSTQAASGAELPTKIHGLWMLTESFMGISYDIADK